MEMFVLSNDVGGQLRGAWLEHRPTEQQLSELEAPASSLHVVTMCGELTNVVRQSKQMKEGAPFAIPLRQALPIIFMAFTNGWDAFRRCHDRKTPELRPFHDLCRQLINEWDAAKRPQDKFENCDMEPGMIAALETVNFHCTPGGMVVLGGTLPVALFSPAEIESMTIDSFKTGWNARLKKTVASG